MRATRGMAMAVLLMSSLAPTSASADCELSCVGECKQEAVICGAEVNLQAKIGRQQCDADAADAVLICEADAVAERSDCIGLCGPDLGDCSKSAKANLKACKEQAKIELAGCENEVATLQASDRALCAQDAADCAASCVE
jgi:hypothetical protein